MIYFKVKNIYYSVLIFISAISFNCQNSRGSSETIKTLTGKIKHISRVTESITDLVREGGVPGLSWAVINDSIVVYEGGIGLRRKDSTLINNKNTIFNAASFSKTVFAYLVMKLSADDLIDLDKPLTAYLKKSIETYPDYTDISQDKRIHDITARMVLSHTAGFPNWRFFMEDGKLKFLFSPGTRFSYSGEGIHLLQLVIEEITGENLETLSRKNIFEPFGMKRTSYIWREDFEQNFTFPHDQYERVKKFRRRTIPDAAGSMQTTAGDYARFIQGILSQNGIADKMFTPQIQITSKQMFGPDSWNKKDMNNSIKLSWALGWGYFESKYGRAVFHTGHDIGAQNYAVIYLDKGIGLVLMGNSDNFESLARRLAFEIIEDTDSPFDWLGYPHYDPQRDRTPPQRPVTIELQPKQLKKYVGEYSYMQNRRLLIRQEGNKLSISEDNLEWTSLSALSLNHFIIEDEGIEFIFHSDQTDQITGFDLLVEGLNISGTKIK